MDDQPTPVWVVPARAGVVPPMTGPVVGQGVPAPTIGFYPLVMSK
jgi:hypothetical protein